jgi:glycosyltransferase involved in cell wall biosynthesis
MPGCLIEAGMMGVPVAAYAIAGVPEVVVDGVTGRLTSAGDMEGLAIRVLELLADPETSGAMADAAREHCRLRFDIEAIAPMYLKLYEELDAS